LERIHERSLNELARECRPPLTSAECRNAAKSSAKPTGIRNSTVSEWLAITVGESAQLRGKFGRYAWHAVGEAKAVKGSRSRKIVARRNEMLAIIADGGRVLSDREMANVLTSRGYAIRHSQVANEYRSLGIESGKTPIISANTRKLLPRVIPPSISRKTEQSDYSRPIAHPITSRMARSAAQQALVFATLAPRDHPEMRETRRCR
jgi:hypothetical protein